MHAAFFFFLAPLPFFCCFDLCLSYSRGRLKSLGKISLPKGSVVGFAPLFGSTLRINLTLDHSVGECPSPVSRRQLNTIATTCRFSAPVPHYVGRGAICYYAFPCGVTNFPLVSAFFTSSTNCPSVLLLTAANSCRKARNKISLASIQGTHEA